MKGVKIVPKKFSKQYLKDHSNMIFKNRELIVEEEKGTDKDSTILRFKIGDGVTPYHGLKYTSSLYALFPEIVFYDESYDNYIAVDFGGEK